VTGVLASRSRDTVKRNMAALPAYSLVLGLIALLGYMAIAANVTPVTTNGKPDVNTVVPLLFDNVFPSWFAGVAFAAVGIGALVPAAIMSIAAANLWTRNIFVEYIKRDATPAQEAASSKIASLVVKVGAVVAVLALDPQFSIDLQLIGGVIVLQTLPPIVLGLYSRWFHRWALLAGWAVGMIAGLYMVYDTPNPATGKQHVGGSSYLLSNFGIDTKTAVYTGLLALIANLIVVVVGTLLLRAVRAPDGKDETHVTDYELEAGDPGVEAEPAEAGVEAPAKA
jgi:SSS family solute:Na+ symporter